jgi:hypothetical protein
LTDFYGFERIFFIERKGTRIWRIFTDLRGFFLLKEKEHGFDGFLRILEDFFCWKKRNTDLTGFYVFERIFFIERKGTRIFTDFRGFFLLKEKEHGFDGFLRIWEDFFCWKKRNTDLTDFYGFERIFFVERKGTRIWRVFTYLRGFFLLKEKEHGFDGFLRIWEDFFCWKKRNTDLTGFYVFERIFFVERKGTRIWRIFTDLRGFFLLKEKEYGFDGFLRIWEDFFYWKKRNTDLTDFYGFERIFFTERKGIRIWRIFTDLRGFFLLKEKEHGFDGFLRI